MTGGIGTRSVVVDGVYTGELDGPFCYGPGKVEAIEQLARWEGLDLAQCYAYSDSASDLPMFEAVGHPVAVNPDGPLTRHARRRGWPIVHFSQRTRAVIRRAAAGAAATALTAAGFAGGVRYARMSIR
jgi:phosphoserine phosphatase